MVGTATTRGAVTSWKPADLRKRSRVRKPGEGPLPSHKQGRTVIPTSSSYSGVVLHRLGLLAHTRQRNVHSSTTVPSPAPTGHRPAERRTEGSARSRNCRRQPIDTRRDASAKEAAMHCPYCRHTDTRVLDSRVAEDGTSIRRRRSCPQCEKRFTTVEQMQLTVVKRSGRPSRSAARRSSRGRARRARAVR